MRYLKLAILLTLIALTAAALEAAPAASGTALSLFLKSDVIPYLVVPLILGPWVIVTSRGRFGRFLQLYWARVGASVAGFVAMFGFGLAIVLILLGIFALAGKTSWEGSAAQGQLIVAFLTVISAVLLASAVAIVEELVFRGFLVSYLRWNTSAVVTIGAVVASAAIFATAHKFHDPLDWLRPAEFPLFVGLFLLGILLAVAYIVTQSLWCPIGLHAALVAFDLAALQGDLITLDLSPWWLGGTGDVREAPALWLAFIVAASILVMARKWLRRHFAIEQPFVGALLASQSPPHSPEQPRSAGFFPAK